MNILSIFKSMKKAKLDVHLKYDGTRYILTENGKIILTCTSVKGFS